MTAVIGRHSVATVGSRLTPAAVATAMAQSTQGGIANATFNFKMCAFPLTIKNTTITAGCGIVDFHVAFAGYNQVVQVTLP